MLLLRRCRPWPSVGVAASPKYLRRGKVKEVYEVSDTELEFRFTNDISVFDKHIPSEIPHKGETLALTAAHWFQLCTRSQGSAPLHRPRRADGHAGPTGPGRTKPATLGPSPKNYLLPLEFIMRYYVAGFDPDRVKAGSVRAEEPASPRASASSTGSRSRSRSSR